MTSERELVDPVELCDAHGMLLPGVVGWSRRSLHHYNLSKNRLPKKRWNYWWVNRQEYQFSATITNVD